MAPRLWAAASLALSTALVLLALHGLRSVVQHGLYGSYGGKIYYDAYHGAHHLWDRDNGRHRHSYHTVSGYYRYYQALQEAGFEVDVATDHGFDRDRLADYDAFYIGEQTRHGHFMTDREVEDLLDWVEDGGGLFVTAEHTNAFHMNDVVNRLFEALPLRARNDGLTDRKQRAPVSADWVVLSQPEEGEVHPIAEGIEAYMLFAGCSVDTPHGVLFSSKTSWSDHYGAHAPPLFPADGKHQPDEPWGPLPGVAAMEFGAGRIVLVCDHNAFSNPNLYWGDHHRFARQSMAWLVGPRFNADATWGLLAVLALGLLAVPGGAARRRRLARATALAAGIGLGAVVLERAQAEPIRNILLVRAQTSGTRLMTKQGLGHYTFYSCLTKDPHLRPWVDDMVVPGYDALVLVAPTDVLSDAELEVVDGYLAAGKTVLYLANRRSLEADAGRQLMDHFAFEVELGKPLPMAKGESEMPFEVSGPPPLLSGIFRFWVASRIQDTRVSGLDPVVVLYPGEREPSTAPDAGRDPDGPRVDMLSERKIGPGTFAVLAPIGLFDTKALGELYEPQDLIREQMRELSLRIVAEAAGHDWAAELTPER